jgi:hypothetical protein
VQLNARVPVQSRILQLVSCREGLNQRRRVEPVGNAGATDSDPAKFSPSNATAPTVIMDGIVAEVKSCGAWSAAPDREVSFSSIAQMQRSRRLVHDTSTRLAQHWRLWPRFQRVRYGIRASGASVEGAHHQVVVERSSWRSAVRATQSLYLAITWCGIRSNTQSAVSDAKGARCTSWQV